MFHHFDSERYIRMKTDVSGYAIGGVLSQLTSDDLGQWHPLAFFSHKMIPVETRYKTHNGELLAIVELFKTWGHYLPSMRCLYSPTTTTSASSWTQRVWAPDKSARPKSSLVTTFKSTIVKPRLMKLPMPYFNILNKMEKRKKSSALRMSRFCTACSLRWLKYLVFQ